MRQTYRQLAGAALLLCLTAGAAGAADDEAVANLGSQPVKAADLKEFIDGLNPAQREQAAKDPKIMVQLVRSAVGRKLLIDEAEKQGWDKKPEVAAQIARARRDIVLGTYLRSVGAPPSSFPNDAELRAAYDANRERFRQYHVAQIFIAEPPGSSKEAIAILEKKARDLAKKAKAKGADFAALARGSSDDAASAPKGGDLGWLAESQILPEILGAVMATPEKGVSEPIHAAGGWHIMTVLGAKQAELGQVREQIANILRQSKTTQNEQAYVEKLLDDKHLTVNETAAAKLFAAKK
jgi:parvulin-like peptidyl-prolyl isomerase